MEVDVPLSVAWELWSDREGVNRWMPWIASIKVPNTYPFSTMFFLFLISIQGSNLKGRVPFRFEGLEDSEPFNADMQT